MTGADFCARLRAAGVGFFSGVPDSTFGDAFAALAGADDWLPAVREDLAVGAAAGAWLGGRLPAVLMQNSGIGTALNAVLSLALLYRVPLLMVVGWRGHGGAGDAPEHLHTGRTLEAMLRAVEIPFVAAETATLGADVDRAAALARESAGPAALLLRAGMVSC